MPYKTLAAVGGQFATGLLNNAISQQNAEDQRDWQQMMWMAQNKWNDPSAMADRMRRAGLNPFTMTNAEPAGSAGTGAMAQTFPIESPLAALKTVAEVENLNASTGRIESDTEKLYKEIALLDLAYERGLIEKDDYERKVKAYWEAYNDKSEFELGRELTESNIASARSSANLSDATKNALESKLPYEIESLQSSSLLAKETALSESYKREFYTASSENQRSMAVKNYAESRLIQVKTDIESAFGALQAEANLTKTQYESQVIVPLANSLIALQDSVAMLNKDTVRHNKVTEDIQKEAVRVQQALSKIKANEHFYGVFKDFVDRVSPDVENLLSSIGGLL